MDTNTGLKELLEDCTKKAFIHLRNVLIERIDFIQEMTRNDTECSEFVKDRIDSALDQFKRITIITTSEALEKINIRVIPDNLLKTGTLQ